jgi:hypothetical protein
MKHTFIHLLCFATLSLSLLSCTKEGNGIEEPTGGLKEVEDICTQMEDITFRNFCYENFDTDKDGKVSMTEADAVSQIKVFALGIESLTGIEYFTNLTALNCNFNKLSSLDVSKCTNLTELNCSSNELVSLNVSNCTHLNVLDCHSNQLTSLDVSGCADLVTLGCQKNELTSLNVNGCVNLETLRCYHNKLTTLDVSTCANLSTLDCSDNPLTILYVHPHAPWFSIKYPQGVEIESKGM